MEDQHPPHRQQISPGSHPFQVDDSDHCETPFQAYKDLEAVLDRLLWIDIKAKKKRPRSELKIYDPYYCDGGVKTKLGSLGFTKVINRNRDFYKDIASNQIPDYDVLVTNPPYSGVHIERLLEFCDRPEQGTKPIFLLLPHFVYTKDYYQRALSNPNVFYFLVPEVRYAYVPPSWVIDRRGASKALAKGKDTTAPFPSFWYCKTPTSIQSWLPETFGPSGSIQSHSKTTKLRYAKIPMDIPRDFKGEFDVTKKRPNPRARKRQRQKQFKQQQQGHTNPTQQQQPKKKKKKRY